MSRFSGQGRCTGSVILMGLVTLLMAGCSGGGGGSGETAPSSQPTEVQHSLVLEATIRFPEGSPLESGEASVLSNGDFSPVDEDNRAEIEIATDRAVDVTLFLPSRDGVEPPTVYLNTTVVPGESEVALDIEETAVSLLLSGLDQSYLADATTASYAKSIVARHADAFVADLAAKMAADPYVLRAETIDTVLGPTFSQAVADSDAELMAVFSPETAAETPAALAVGAVAPRALSSRAAAYAQEAQLGDLFIRYDRDPPFQGFQIVPANTLWHTKLTFYNGSMLPVLTRITDTSADEVLKEIPATFFDRAFSPELLTPTTGPFSLPLPNWEEIDNGTRNILIEVFTPGLSDVTESHYLDAGSPSPALLSRACFSSAILPLVGLAIPTLPMGGGSTATQAAEAIFGALLDANIFEKIIYHWTRGEFQLGLVNAYDDMASYGIYNQVVNTLVEMGLASPAVSAELAARLGLKVATAKVALASAGISIAAMVKGLVETPSKVSYQVIYPVGLHGLEPRAAEKIPEDQENTEAFTLTGHGLSAVTFDGETHSARLLLEAYDREDTKLSEAWLDELFGFDIQAGGDSAEDTLTFKLPDAMVRTGTDITYIRLTVHHAYESPGWLADYTDWFSTLETVALPATDTGRRTFTIHMTQDVRITRIEPTVLEKGGSLSIVGEGFAGADSGLENEVYFVDRDNQPVAASILSASETEIRAYLPIDLRLNESDNPLARHIGSSEVYVELSDGSRSTPAWTAVIPDPVTFSPAPGTSEQTYKYSTVSLHQASERPIYYTVNDSVERAYAGPITITETCTIKAYAKVVVDGVIYSSEVSSQDYLTCQEGETFVPYPHGAQCLVIQNQDLIPRRYCPVDSEDYTAPIATSFGQAVCSYSWSLIPGALGQEKHQDVEGSTNYAVIQYWTPPVGRPSYVWRPTASYHFCPDGSFWDTDGTCSH